MALKIIKKNTLSAENLTNIKHLYEVCNSYDNSNYTFDVDDDFSKENDINTFLLFQENELVSSITLFAPTKKEAELIALTLPQKRKQGYFTMLLKEAIIEIKRRDIKSILFVSDSKSNSGINTIKHLKTTYDFSEYLLKFNNKEKLLIEANDNIQITMADIKDKEKLTCIVSKAFNTKIKDESDRMESLFSATNRTIYSIKFKTEVVGLIGICEEEDRTYIFGFSIDPNFQKKGIGSYTLSEIVKICLLNNKDIVLEVQADNLNALNVYVNAGFAIQTEFKYYRSNY
jgi:ribosomal protein S18 acetylase RimI-like enzyme